MGPIPVATIQSASTFFSLHLNETCCGCTVTVAVAKNNYVTSMYIAKKIYGFQNFVCFKTHLTIEKTN